MYSKSKDLVKKEIGHIRNDEPIEYKKVLDFDNSMDDKLRREKLEELFAIHVVPFIDKSLSKSGIVELARKGDITLLPAVKHQLGA